MLRKLTVLLMAALFSFSVAGLSYAQTKPSDKPADKPATNPCAAGEEEMGKKKAKKAQKVAEKKAACLEKATTDQAKADCEKQFAAKAKTPKKAKEGATLAPEKAKPAEPAKAAEPPTKK